MVNGTTASGGISPGGSVWATSAPLQNWHVVASMSVSVRAPQLRHASTWPAMVATGLAGSAAHSA